MSSTSDYWSAKAASGYAPNWYSFCRETINARVSGNPHLPPSLWGLQTYAGKPTAHLLEVGCLSGDKLMVLVEAGFALRGSGVDIAAEAIERGVQRHGSRLDLKVMDLNAPALPRATYSAVSANGVLHHIAEVERLADALYEALLPGGVLIASEFTGPRRYAYSAKEVRLIREGQSMLPEELRGEPFDPGQFRAKLEADPSESVRTRDLGAVLAATFDELIVREYGGNILMRALTPTFFRTFSSERADHVAATERLITFDTAVSAAEPPHHAFFVARKAG